MPDIKVYSSTGQEVKSFNLTGKLQGKFTLSAGMLPVGSYVYMLLINSIAIDSKKLVITR